MSDRNDFARMSDSALAEWHLRPRTVDELRSDWAQLAEQLAGMTAERDLTRRALAQEMTDNRCALAALSRRVRQLTAALHLGNAEVEILRSTLTALYTVVDEAMKGTSTIQNVNGTMATMAVAQELLEELESTPNE